MCIHELAQAHANATPDATAVVARYRQISYRELDSRANQLAHLLRARGVGAEVPVALCMRRSPELVIAALAILKAGGAYVPLDPTYPANRLTILLQDSGALQLITQPDIAAQVPAGPWETIVLDEVGSVASSYPTVPPICDTKPENLAYIIFTSGSTGRPKGVQISHANLLNLVRWHQEAFAITAADKATMQSSPGFDASVWELWPYLATGAAVHIVDEAVRTNPELLRDWMVAAGITISFLPTALAEAMIGLSWPPETQLRGLLTGADTLRRRPPLGLPFALVNNYGPTECTVVATSGTVEPDPDSSELPSIGCPISNTQVYIVDEGLNLVPPGTPGELLVGGAGVSRGYLNLPELTAEKFIPDSFSGVSGARLYRTGDWGRALPNGQIAFLGRIDEQIKIRGYRIEPPEITAVLDRHPAIQASCVAACSNGSADARLVAYLVMTKDATAKGAQPKPIELRKFLGEHLPDYMVPASFVQLPELPLSVNGKLDRGGLPQPTAANTMPEDFFEEPQSPIEERLAALLSPLLGTRVGREDNIFNLGGHSLMGAQIIAKIRQTFGVDLSLRSVFDRPTVRELSAEIERLVHAKLDAMSEDEAQQILASASLDVQ